VFAGRAEPRSLVTITIDGKEIGTAAADENGDWILTTDAKIANPDGKLALFKAPAGTVPGVAGSAQQSAEAKLPVGGPNAQKPKTAGAVTAGMLKSLEGMVAAARTGDGKPPTTIAAVPTPPANAAASPPASPAPAGSPAVQSTTVPLPITFVYNESTLTTDGSKAAALLLEYLQLKGFPAITLTGHADERGSDELNMGLSRERLDTVARFLREGGYRGQLKLVPKGKSEPYTGVVRGDFSQEDLWQLDRRVELVVSR
jgi:outer membrane protein OmpA-like peptidoglycan-associated protein